MPGTDGLWHQVDDCLGANGPMYLVHLETPVAVRGRVSPRPVFQSDLKQIL